MKHIVLYTFLFLISLSHAYAEDHIVVAELFTSQSCSSCPAADKVLKDISDSSNIITLSCNVTYWNHLNWVDTLSSEFCTKRQRQYARLAFDTQRVYTPQMIVNGRTQFIGSHKNSVRHAMENGHSDQVKKIHMAIEKNRLGIEYPTLSNNQSSYEVVLLGTTDTYTESVKQGENRGKKLTYTNAVRNIQYLADYNGISKQLNLPLPPLKAATNQLIILVQDPQTRAILAAGSVKL